MTNYSDYKDAAKSNHIGYLFDHMPRWIKHSGLPELLGGSAWQLFSTLLEIESRYRRERPFHISHEEIGKVCGCKRGWARKNLEVLEKKGYIKYTPGRYKTKESEIRIVYPIKTPKKVTEVDRKRGGLTGLQDFKQLREEDLRYLRDWAGVTEQEIEMIKQGNNSQSVSKRYPLDKTEESNPHSVFNCPQSVSGGHNLEKVENTLVVKEEEEPPSKAKKEKATQEFDMSEEKKGAGENTNSGENPLVVERKNSPGRTGAISTSSIPNSSQMEALKESKKWCQGFRLISCKLDPRCRRPRRPSDCTPCKLLRQSGKYRFNVAKWEDME